MTTRARSRKEELAQLRDQLRGEGWTPVRIAARIRAEHGVNIRVAFRLAHGLTQQQVADRWNTLWPEDGPKTGKHISYWEAWPAPSGRTPTIATLGRLAAIYECRPGDLLDQDDYAPTAADDAGTRRAEIEVVRPPTVERPAWPAPPRFDELDHRSSDRSFLTVTQLLASQRQAVAPQALIALVDAHRATLTMIFDKTGKNDPVRADVGALIGETSIVASRLYSAIGRRAQAIAYCVHARHLADDLHNPVLGATARIFESNLRSEAATLIGAGGDMAVGLRMLDEAADVGHLLGPAARARIAAEQAQIYALLDLRHDCQDALDRARHAVDDIADTDRIGLFSDWSPARLHVYEGTCWLFLNDIPKATELLERAVRELNADHNNVNVLLAARVDLASAYAEGGDLDEGCRTLGDAYTQLARIGNSRGIERARGARRRLERWNTERPVRDLDERLSAALTTASTH
jgi:transcriptional regulator with XRE-family HTH domain